MTHKIINTGDYLLIVDDNSIMATKGQWVLETHNYTNPNTISEISGDWDCNRNGYKDKIILAHLPINNSPILEGVSLLPDLPPLEDELDKIYDEVDYAYSDWKYFERGYNKAKEKYFKPIPDWVYTKLCVYDKRNPDYLLYDEDDLTKQPKKCSCDNCFYGRTKMANFIIQSLQQPKIPVGFKRSIERLNVLLDEKHISFPAKKTNSKGLTQWVGEYIY